MIIPNSYHLKYFIDAVDLGSISASASKNRVSHPAVSQAIKNLEEQLDINLLNHNKRKFEVTAEGHALAIKGREILALLQNIGESTSTPLRGVVRLGISQSMTQKWLVQIVKRLTKQHPEIKLEVIFGTTSELLRKTAKGDLDLSITLEKQTLPTLTQTLITEGHFLVIASPSKKDPSNMEFMLTEPRYETEQFKKSYKETFGRLPTVSHEVGSWSAIIELVANDLGAGLVPDFILTAENKKKVRVLRSDWLNCPYKIYLNFKENEDSKKPLRASLSQIIQSVKS